MKAGASSKRGRCVSQPLPASPARMKARTAHLHGNCIARHKVAPDVHINCTIDGRQHGLVTNRPNRPLTVFEIVLQRCRGCWPVRCRHCAVWPIREGNPSSSNYAGFTALIHILQAATLDASQKFKANSPAGEGGRRAKRPVSGWGKALSFLAAVAVSESQHDLAGTL